MRLAREYIFNIILPRLQAVGIDPVELLADANLPLSDLEETRGRYMDTCALFESVERRIVGPFEFAQATWPGPPHETPLNLLLASQPTVRHALSEFQEFGSSLADGLELEVHPDTERTHIRFLSTDGTFHAGAIEWWVASFASLLRQVTHDRLAIIGFSFRHAARSQVDRYDRSFGVAATFSSDADGVEIATADLELPLPHQSSLIASTMKRLLREESQNRSHLHRHQIEAKSRLLLLARLRLRQGTQIADIAMNLGMSSRNYQRRLQQSGVSFREIKEQTLVDFAKDLLAVSEDSIEGISRRSGFSHKSAFHRAFKRATGKTPTEFRFDHHRSPDPTATVRLSRDEAQAFPPSSDDGDESKSPTRPQRS